MNLFIKLPMFKPNEQLSVATNKMFQNQEKCIFYTTHYRLVTRPVAGASQSIQESDIFTGSRPKRVYMSLYTLRRWNGGLGHESIATDVDINTTANAVATAEALNSATHPLRAPLPHFNYTIVSVNEAIVQAELKNVKCHSNIRNLLRMVAIRFKREQG